MGRTTNVITKSGNIGGQTLVPGLYKSTSSLAISSGDLTLDAQGNANAVWIFQIASTFTTTSGRQVILAGGAQAKNIFWAVGSSATLGTGSIFYGNILAHISVTMTSTSTMVGRSLASTGAVTCNGNGATNPDSVRSNTPVFSTASRSLNDTANVDSIKWTLISIYNPGTANLNITSATSTNVLFSSHLSAMIVAPGGSVIDSIKFHPTAIEADSGKLIFASNALSSPDTIIVHGVAINGVKGAVFSTTSRSVNVGSIQIDSILWKFITLSNTGTDTLRITTMASTNTFFSSHLSKSLIAPGASIIDSIKFLPTAIGADSGKLIFTSNAITSPDTIIVYGNDTVSGDKTAILAMTSRIVNCGTTQVGKTSSALITLTNTGTDTLRIATATCTNAFFTSHLSKLVIAPGASIIDSIMFLPMAAGTATGNLMVVSNAITSPDTIAMSGIGILTGAILATISDNVDCGTTQVGKPLWTLITFSNTGNEALIIAITTTTNTVFTSHLSAMTIAPGASITDSIMFLPTSIGVATGMLLVISNATGTATHSAPAGSALTASLDTIALHGIGTAVSAVSEGTSPASSTLGEMYPNPVSDETQLQVRMQDGERLVHAGMYDMLGRELQDWTARITSSGSLSLHLGYYPNGMYYARILTTSRMQILSVVIAK
jgi:hypothetical protein